jgi:hypothetical protein
MEKFELNFFEDEDLFKKYINKFSELWGIRLQKKFLK